jgi:hypothetical protein
LLSLEPGHGEAFRFEEWGSGETLFMGL